MNEIVQSNAERDAVVAAYKEAGLGGERYGVVCPIIDEETGQRCNKRICPQGWVAARNFNDAMTKEIGKYCMHRENYDEEHEDITDILGQHGLEWRPLRTLSRMRENSPKLSKKGKKNVSKKQGPAQRSGYDPQTGGRGGFDPSVGILPGDESSLVPGNGEDRGPTFSQYLNGKVDGSGRTPVPPSDGQAGRARLFLARREREEAERQASGDGTTA